MRLDRLVLGLFLLNGLSWYGHATVEESAGTLPRRVTLPNGLQVVVVEDRLAPVVTVELSVLAGGVESPVEYPGLAHAQEHMAFRGCAGMTSDQTAAIYTQLGGQKDADTDKNCNAVGGLMNVWVITARTSVGYVALRKNGFSGGPANTAAPAVSVGSIALASDVSLLQLVPTSTVPNQMCEK